MLVLVQTLFILARVLFNPSTLNGIELATDNLARSALISLFAGSTVCRKSSLN